MSVKSQRGASLIETIVALLIMGAGLMGVLSMQVKSVGFLKDASLYSQAAFLAEDIYEGMLTTPSAKASYYISYSDSPPAKPSCTQTDSNCSPRQIAAWNLYNWRNNVANLLPGGKGEISQLGNQIVIRIQFSGRSDDEDEIETKEYQLITDV